MPEAVAGPGVVAMTDPDVLTTREARELLRIGRDALYAACAENRIPHRRIGRVIRFSKDALMRWLAREEAGDASAT
jgi:excisionase family DNA binding protein